MENRCCNAPHYAGWVQINHSEHRLAGVSLVRWQRISLMRGLFWSTALTHPSLRHSGEYSDEDDTLPAGYPHAHPSSAILGQNMRFFTFRLPGHRCVEVSSRRLLCMIDRFHSASWKNCFHRRASRRTR